MDNDQTFPMNPDTRRPSRDLEAWVNGQVILDNYRIVRMLGSGGMGKVYLIERQISGKCLQFAVKTLQESLLNEPGSRIGLLREVQTWIDLPKHTNIAGCRFFRTIGPRLAIFSEYVDGGSLDSWLSSKKITSLDQVIDIGIQVAWGLSAAHSRHVIHQDIKPSNILMTREGIPKITDFGLAGMKTGFSKCGTADGRSTVMMTGAGYTPAYCAPEQMQKEKISRRTDIWNWGVTFLELILGKRNWQFGVLAPEAVCMVELFVPHRAAGNITELLSLCFKENPWERWQHIDLIADRLTLIYQDLTSEEYPRQKPVYPILSEPEEVASEPVRYRDPESWLELARKTTGSENHQSFGVNSPEGNSFVPHTYQSRLLHNLETMELTLGIMEPLIDPEHQDELILLAELLHDTAGLHAVIMDSSGAIGFYDQALNLIRPRLTAISAPKMIQLAATLAMRLGQTHIKLADFSAGIALFNESLNYIMPAGSTAPSSGMTLLFLQVQILLIQAYTSIHQYSLAESTIERTIKYNEESSEAETGELIRYWTAQLYENKGLLELRTGHWAQAVSSFEAARISWHYLIKSNPGADFSYRYAANRSNSGLAKVVMSQYDEAVGLYREAIDLLSELVENKGCGLYRMPLAVICNNMASVAMEKNLTGPAWDSLKQSEKYLKELVFNEGLTVHSDELARNLALEAHWHEQQANWQKAANLFDQALELVEFLIFRDGREELYPNLARFQWEYGMLSEKAGMHQSAIDHFLSSIESLHHLGERTGQADYWGDIAWVRVHIAACRLNMGQIAAAEKELREAVPSLEAERHRTGREDLIQALEMAEKLSDSIRSARE